MAFALTALLSAFLLFLVQPMMGRFVLPWFGGGSTVWTICMLFFQSGLLAGYAYAHLLALRLPVRRGLWVHGGLVALSLLALPIVPRPPDPGDTPTHGNLGALAAAVALPYLVLSATAPLIQAWAARVDHRSPYRLYAWSNTGSLGALIAYPLLIEPRAGLTAQANGWSLGYAAFALAITFCAWRVHRAAISPAPDAAPATDTADTPPPGRRAYALWIGCTTIASALLLATTDRLTEDISASPLLWVLPLGLYLTTFILCFGHPATADRRLWFALLPPAGFVTWYAMHQGADLGMLAQIILYNAVLFIGCMALHGEVVRARPAPTHLTGFYLATALGGALGGVLVGLVAPALLPVRIELQLAVIATGALAAYRAWQVWRDRPFASTPLWIAAALPLMVVLLAAALARDQSVELRGVTAIDRGFYGVLRVKEIPAGFLAEPARKLVHGRIMHGQQFTGSRRNEPLSYYAAESGIGRYFEHHAAAPPQRIAAVGLGIGTLAAYGRCGDTLDFYEIDPLVERFARQAFTYLNDTCATVRVVLGDGRRELARSQTTYDAIVLDAFSSDAIPAHLLTREAWQMYLAHLAPDGIIIVNIANRYLDLRPVIRAHADALALDAIEIASSGNWFESTAHTRWVFAGRRSAFIDAMRAADLHTERLETATPLAWTDDFAPLLPLMKDW